MFKGFPVFSLSGNQISLSKLYKSVPKNATKFVDHPLICSVVEDV
jgi:hypothetical protein